MLRYAGKADLTESLFRCPLWPAADAQRAVVGGGVAAAAAWICITKASCSIDRQRVKAVYQQMSLSLGKTMGD